MECPRCGNELDKAANKVESQSGAMTTAYKCPSCELVFRKKTLLRKGLGWVGRVSLAMTAGLLLGDHGGGGDYSASA